MRALVFSPLVALAILTNHVDFGTVRNCMPSVLLLTFQNLAATKDARLFLDETLTSMGQDVIQFHGWLVTALTRTFDKN